MELYHASPTAGLTVLKPSVTEYFGKPRQVCLTALKPMALLEAERLGTMKIVRWAEVSKGTRDRIRRTEMREILEAGLLGQDSPRARYMREKYPESWAMAQEEDEK